MIDEAGKKLGILNSNSQAFGTVAGTGIVVTEFDGNIITGVTQTGIVIDKTIGSVTVNGTLDTTLSNQVSNEVGNKLGNGTAAPDSGQFYLNGVLVTLPTTVP